MIAGLRLYQEAQTTKDPAEWSRLMNQANFLIADYEQRQVAQAYIGPLTSAFGSISDKMHWTDASGMRHDFMPSGNFADVDDRLEAIRKVSERTVELAGMAHFAPGAYDGMMRRRSAARERQELRTSHIGNKI